MAHTSLKSHTPRYHPLNNASSPQASHIRPSPTKQLGDCKNQNHLARSYRYGCFGLSIEIPLKN
ncbi:hypothetical protein ACTXT7_015153 [Hymenolepis weldensis]